MQLEIFANHDYPNLDAIVSQFTSDHACNIIQACFWVAGLVVHGRCEATNLPWVVDAQVLACALNLATVGVINDLEANAYGIAILLYVLSPFDFLPAFIPFIGEIDDAVLVTLVATEVSQLLLDRIKSSKAQKPA